MHRRRFIQIAGLAALGGAYAPQCARADQTQKDWAWCKGCQGMWFTGNDEKGKCPAGGKHVSEGSGSYVLVHDDKDAKGQNKWRWCHKCQGLWFSGGDDNGSCPAGKAHSDKDSG